MVRLSTHISCATSLLISLAGYGACGHSLDELEIRYSQSQDSSIYRDTLAIASCRGMLSRTYPKNTLISIQDISAAVNLSLASRVKVVRNPS